MLGLPGLKKYFSHQVDYIGICSNMGLLGSVTRIGDPNTGPDLLIKFYTKNSNLIRMAKQTLGE